MSHGLAEQMEHERTQARLLAACHASWLQTAVNRAIAASIQRGVEFAGPYHFVPDLEPPGVAQRRAEEEERRNDAECQRVLMMLAADDAEPIKVH